MSRGCHVPVLRFVTLFPPTSCSLTRLPSCPLDTRLVPSNCCAPTSPKACQAACLADVKTVALANLTVPCIRPIDIVLGHPRLLWTVLVLQPSCALFFRFLSSVSFPSQYATRSLAH